MHSTLMRVVGAALVAHLMQASSPLGHGAETARVRFQPEPGATEITVEGQIVVTAADGGLLLEDPTGILYTITPDRLLEQHPLDQAFTPLPADELGARLEEQLGNQFRSHATDHYVLCSNANDEFNDWVGRLFERLLRAFLKSWERTDLDLHEPPSPLPALIFRTREEYAKFATDDAGPQFAAAAGYYSQRTNRIVLYDVAAAGGPGNNGDLNRRATAVPANVATIIHEATHQIAFNCGLHTRYADNPVWATEGLAMYCETPDLDSGSGWRTIGRLNAARLRDYRATTAQRSDGFLKQLIMDDARFRDPDAAAGAYAESWALTYFLLQTNRPEYSDFLGLLSRKPRLQWDSPEQRLQEFESTFGPVADLETDLQRYMARLR